MPRLFTPGPVEVPRAGLLAMARQVRHHRTPEFRRTMSAVVAGLKELFQTAGDVLVLASSGTGGMEAAVVNTVPRGGKALVLEQRFGIKLGEGQGPLKGRIFRIAQMGQIGEVDILGCLAAIELVLLEMGHEVTLVAAVTAASETFRA